MQTRKLTNEEASALLANVAEEWKSFWFSHGAVAKNLEELAVTLGTMTEEQFVHHVNPEKNDLACWVDEVIGDTTLAAKLRLLRTQAATHTMTTRRVSELRAALAPVVTEAAPVVADQVQETAPEATVPSPVTVTAAVTLTAPKKRAPKAKAEAKKSAPAAKAKKEETKGSVWSRLLKG